MTGNLSNAAPFDTHPARASALVRGDQVWIGYPNKEPLVGYLDEAPTPIGSGDYRLVLNIYSDEGDSTETTLVSGDYAELRRFYPRAQFTDADAEYVAGILLGEVVITAGAVELHTGAERLSLGPATPALRETLRFLSTPRNMDDGVAFMQAREDAGAAPIEWPDPDLFLATWRPSIDRRRGNAMNAAEAATLSRFKYVGARLDGSLHEDDLLGWCVATPDRPNVWCPIQDWLRIYLTDPEFSGFSLYDFAHSVARVSDTTLEDVTRDILFSLNWVAGRGVTLVGLPRPTGVRRLVRKFAGRG